MSCQSGSGEEPKTHGVTAEVWVREMEASMRRELGALCL